MKQDKSFRLSKTSKRIISSLATKDERNKWLKAFIQAELNDSPRMMMNYDVSPSGKIPRKVKGQESQND